jgi:hypothetical protein
MTLQLSTQNLALYNLQKPFVEPTLRMCRLTNTALDILFYDVGVLTAALWAKGTAIKTGGATDGASSPAHPLQTLDLTAATNPSGSIIIVNANAAPYVGQPFLDMGEFFAPTGRMGRASHPRGDRGRQFGIWLGGVRMGCFGGAW